MVQYESLRNDADHLEQAIVDGMLKPIAFENFKQDRGTAVKKVLPDKSDHYDFSTENFSGFVDPDTRRFDSPEYNGVPITTSRILAQPDRYFDIVDDVTDLWWDTFGDVRQMSSQPQHPGEPPISNEAMKNIITDLSERKELLVADPMLEDLTDAIKDKNHRLAAQFLNLDVDPVSLFTPRGEHEMSDLFTKGEIHIVYKDRDLALLKPEYHHEIRQEVINQQTTGWRRVRLTGTQPELGFVVGLDDTPTGLFAHSVDATNLDVDQSVTRDQIHDVMGFDYNYDHQDVLDPDVGDRIRIQGDLAVRRLSDESVESADRCNIPIDNHLSMLTHGRLPDGESRESEPITVQIPSLSTLNVAHDEHDNVAAQLTQGEYEFYLLPRGLQPARERPSWF